jgi:hypothetical protein
MRLNFRQALEGRLPEKPFYDDSLKVGHNFWHTSETKN